MNQFNETKKLFLTAIPYDVEKPLTVDQWLECPDEDKAAVIYLQFYEAITHFSKIGRNAHDDAPDALTGTIEFRKDAGRISAVGVFH